MKTYYFILFLVLNSQFGYSQFDYMPLHAEWKYTFHTFERDFPYDCEYNICNQDLGLMKVIDTFHVDGRRVSSIQDYRGVNENSLTPLGEVLNVSERNDSVFIYQNDQFYLLYDFNAVDGDTLTLQIPSRAYGLGASGARPFADIPFDSIVTRQVVVRDIGDTNINGELRRVMNYEQVGDTPYYNNYVIEGLGSGRMFLGTELFFVAEGCFGEVICYSDDNQVYSPYGCCEYPEPYPERTFAPVGAEWLYEGYSDGGGYINDCENNCEGNYNLFRVEEERMISGRNYAVVERYYRTRNTDWEKTGDEILLYDYNDLFYADDNFHQHMISYRTNVEFGDTLNNVVVRYYPKWVGDDIFTYNFPTNGGSHRVINVEEILIDGEIRKKITYEALGEFRLGEVIEGIGPLNEGLLGNDIPILTSGCLPRLLCYRDSNITFENEDCGCQFPIGPTSTLDHKVKDILLSPNPSGSFIELNIEDDIDSPISIYNVSGELITTRPISKRVDISDLQAGMYLLSTGYYKGKFTKL